MRAGLASADGDLLCYTNSARTHAEILALTLAYALAYPGVVIKANRRIRESRRRRLGSLLYNLECRALFDLAAWDINGTPKVFPRSLRQAAELDAHDDLLDAEFNVVCREEDYPMLEVPMLATNRHGGRSTTNFARRCACTVGACALRRATRAVGDASATAGEPGLSARRELARPGAGARANGARALRPTAAAARHGSSGGWWTCSRGRTSRCW